MTEKPYNIRPSRRDDLEKGLLNTLDNLSPTSTEISLENAYTKYEEITKNPDNIIFVAEMNGEVVGTTTLYVKPKLIRGGRYVGRIADVAVRKDYESMGIGSKLIKAAVEEAEKRGCRKVTLSCNEENVFWYTRLGFRKYEIEMRMDFPENR